MLEGNVIVVLGGSGLLGRAFVAQALAQGATVVVGDIKDPQDSKVTYIQCDATSEESVKALASAAKQKFGKVDGVVNATYPSDTRATSNKGFLDGTLEDMLQNASLHLRVCFVTVKAFAPVFQAQKNGSIIFISSIYGVAAPRFDIYEGLPMTQPAEYAAAKGGIIAVTRYFASLLGKDGIRVNCISPGGIAAGQDKTFVERYSKHVVLGEGLLSPDDVSGTVAFLLSNLSSKITGQNIVVDSGWTL